MSDADDFQNGDDILRKVAEARARIGSACAKARRSPDEVEIVAITKTHGPDVVRDAWNAGLRRFGENRVQEAAWKIPEAPPGPEWHLVGHLQRNKVPHALALFPVIEAVDSERLLDAIVHAAKLSGNRPEILFEVNISGEASKFGLRPEAVDPLLEKALGTPEVTVAGLMTMAPFQPDPEKTRPVFAGLRELRDRLERDFGIGLPRLSMGMSNDFEVAVEEGATWVRLGTCLFGQRPKWKPVFENSFDDENG